MSAKTPRVAVLAAAVILLCSITPHPPRIAAPALVLWAWERPEDLRFIDPITTGVAYLAGTASLGEDRRVRYHFRQQPLYLPPAVPLIAVVRIESPARYTFPEPTDLARGILSAVRKDGIKAIQIDYDARASERAFYRALIAEVRRNTDLPIGITALASWCDGDAWFRSEPLTEAVPMFFRMGRNESRNMTVRAPLCRSSLGLSTDEEWPPHRPAGLRDESRLYVFNPHAWTASDYYTVVRKVRNWR